jgi:hypothetical protein
LNSLRATADELIHGQVSRFHAYLEATADGFVVLRVRDGDVGGEGVYARQMPLIHVPRMCQ